MSMLRTALAYAERLGWLVLPIEPRGKVPLTKHGVKDASRDPHVIKWWWGKWPNANIAIAAGWDFFVVDVDVRNGGDEQLGGLFAKYGEFPHTVRAFTGGGGAHYLFTLPPGLKLKGKLAPGIDLLGPGRYFLVAPSIHPSGCPYAWRIDAKPSKVAIAHAPQWLLDLAHVVEPAPEPPRAPAAPPATSTVDRARKYLDKIGGAVSGQGGHTHTFVVASKLVLGFGLDEAAALELLVEWNAKCAPPWSVADLKRKVREAARKGRMQEGSIRDADRRRAG